MTPAEELRAMATTARSYGGTSAAQRMERLATHCEQQDATIAELRAALARSHETNAEWARMVPLHPAMGQPVQVRLPGGWGGSVVG